MAAAGGRDVVGASPAVGGVVVYHRVHGAGTHAEEQARAAELAEVAEVVLPVGLRHDGHLAACCGQRAPYHGGAEGGWSTYASPENSTTSGCSHPRAFISLTVVGSHMSGRRRV